MTKPEDLTILDTVLFLDLSLILRFACFAGTSILSGMILSSICARAAVGKLLVQMSIFVRAFALNFGIYLVIGTCLTTSPIFTFTSPLLLLDP
jgi:hypothetical protein